MFGEPEPVMEEETMQELFTEKQPLVRLMPWAKVEVALPVELNWLAATPPVKVEVEVLETMRLVTVVVPAERKPANWAVAVVEETYRVPVWRPPVKVEVAVEVA